LNPLPDETAVALCNARHPEQFTSFKKMTLEEIQKQYPGMKVERVPFNGGTGVRHIHPDGSSTYIAGIDPYRNEPEFETFWLETDKYYGMVDESELNVVGHLHHLREILPAKKKILLPGEFESFPSFGFGNEYTGITLDIWLKLKNMNSFFENFGKDSKSTD